MNFSPFELLNHLILKTIPKNIPKTKTKMATVKVPKVVYTVATIH